MLVYQTLTLPLLLTVGAKKLPATAQELTAAVTAYYNARFAPATDRKKGGPFEKYSSSFTGKACRKKCAVEHARNLQSSVNRAIIGVN